jgi:hypothetical protein
MVGIAPIYPPAMWSPYDTNEREWKRPTPLTPTPSTPTSCTSSAAKFVRDLNLFSSPDAKLGGAEGHDDDDDDDCEPENLREALAEAPSSKDAHRVGAVRRAISGVDDTVDAYILHDVLVGCDDDEIYAHLSGMGIHLEDIAGAIAKHRAERGRALPPPAQPKDDARDALEAHGEAPVDVDQPSAPGRTPSNVPQGTGVARGRARRRSSWPPSTASTPRTIAQPIER